MQGTPTTLAQKDHTVKEKRTTAVKQMDFPPLAQLVHEVSRLNRLE